MIGLGINQPATEAMIDELIALYGRTFRISLSPAAKPAQLTDWLLERGFRHTHNSAKMIRGTEPPPKIETDLHLEQTDETTAAHHGDIVQVGFQVPDWFAPDGAIVPFGFRPRLKAESRAWPDNEALDLAGRIVLVPVASELLLLSIPNPGLEGIEDGGKELPVLG